MNFGFIEGGETGNKMIMFGGVGVMAEEHRGGGFSVAVWVKEGDKAELG
jgi:hypothetical protein